MKLFAEDEFDREEKAEKHDEYTEPLYAMMKDSKDALCLLPLYPLDAIEEFLKYLVYYKDVSGVKVRLFSEKYLECRGCPMHRLLKLWGEEKYNNMLAELKDLADV